METYKRLPRSKGEFDLPEWFYERFDGYEPTWVLRRETNYKGINWWNDSMCKWRQRPYLPLRMFPKKDYPF